MAWWRQATSHYLSQIDTYLCRQMTSLSRNELNQWTLIRYKKRVAVRIVSHKVHGVPVLYMFPANGTALAMNS